MPGLNPGFTRVRGLRSAEDGSLLSRGEFYFSPLRSAPYRLLVHSQSEDFLKSPAIGACTDMGSGRLTEAALAWETMQKKNIVG